MLSPMDYYKDSRFSLDSYGLNENKTNLIINYLPQTLSDQQFRSLFEQIGSLISARIIRNKNTNYSYGFGFVEYINHDDAKRAIEMLDGHQIGNKRIKVAFSRPHSEDIKQAKLYVKNVPSNLTQERLQTIFQKYGTIIQCRLLESKGKNKGIAFVLYDLHEQAEKAIEALNGAILPGSSLALEIKFAVDKGFRDLGPNIIPNSYGSRYQRNRTDHYNQSASYDYDNFGYSSMKGVSYFNGGVVSGPMRNFQYSNKNYMRYNPINSQLMSQDYGNDMNNYDSSMGINGYPTTQYSKSGSNSDKSNGYILFVYNIGPSTDEEGLWNLFTRFGRVSRCNVIRKGEESRGYGFVTMNNYHDAVSAIHALNGYTYEGKPLQVSFKK